MSDGVKLSHQYNFGGAYRYYGSDMPGGSMDIGLSAFVINHLNLTRQRLVLDMSNARRRGEALVRSGSRVNTGLMKASVKGTGDFGTDILKITFGWDAGEPEYAPYQEFGTRRGVEPMMAVLNAFNQVTAELSARLK